jgi:predicted RNA binding protein YcfA (HicA-like mRNA interferase family)
MNWMLKRKHENQRCNKLIEADGWFLIYQKGSHRQYKNSQKKGRVTIAGHPGDDLAPGTLNSIFKQAGLKKAGN